VGGDGDEGVGGDMSDGGGGDSGGYGMGGDAVGGVGRNDTVRVGDTVVVVARRVVGRATGLVAPPVRRRRWRWRRRGVCVTRGGDGAGLGRCDRDIENGTTYTGYTGGTTGTTVTVGDTSGGTGGVYRASVGTGGYKDTSDGVTVVQAVVTVAATAVMWVCEGEGGECEGGVWRRQRHR